MAIQILQYEFLGPIGLSEWGPPMDKVVYIIFTKNPKFKCWISHAGIEENIYLSIYPMWESSESERLQLAQKIVNKYEPICNQAVDDSQN